MTDRELMELIAGKAASVEPELFGMKVELAETKGDIKDLKQKRDVTMA